MQIRALPNEARYALPQVGRHPSEREVAIPSERVVVISRNDWSSSIGIDGRHQPVRAVMPTARSTEAARWVGRVTDRLVAPSPELKSTTRTHLTAFNASVAEISRAAALSFFSKAR